MTRSGEGRWAGSVPCVSRISALAVRCAPRQCLDHPSATPVK